MKAKELTQLLIQEVKTMDRCDIHCVKELLKAIQTEVVYREIELDKEQEYEYPQF